MIRRLIATSIVLGGISVPAVAQSSAPAVDRGIEEVTVTSRRRAEVAQDVPLPVSAIDGLKLDNTGTFNVNRLQQLQPSLQFISSNPRNTAVNIRGIGAPFGLTNDGIEQGVGFYVDQVYYSRIAASTFDFLDVQQIEVLRGPQGTLYGKNTTAGALNITTRKPTFENEGRAELSYGNLGYTQARGAVSGPLIDDTLAFRLVGSVTKRDGIYQNVTTDTDVNEIDNLGIRGQLLFVPSETLDITLAGDYNRQNPECCAQVYVDAVPTQRALNRQYASLAAASGYSAPSNDPFDRKLAADTELNAKQEFGGASVGTATMQIRLQDIAKQFVGFRALDGVDLDITSGELIALLGPSGSGKTTLLRIIAGLEFADRGDVFFGTENMASRPVRERNVGFVFQHYALFKHMRVRDNVSFGLRMRPRRERPAAAEIDRRANELLELVQLGGLGDRFPHQLSGGQRQRVALARALAIEPRVLLLDEPFGALDAKVRKDLRRWLRELHQRIGTTTIFVTHDQEEALELADRVVIMNRGRIEQVGSCDEVYETPATPFVFEFLGDTNVLDAVAEGRGLLVEGADRPITGRGDVPPGALELRVRPGDLRIADEATPGVRVEVLSVQKTGPIVRAEARVKGSPRLLTVEVPHLHHDAASFRPGAELRLRVSRFSVYAASGLADPNAAPSDAIGVAATRSRSRDAAGASAAR